MDVVIKCPACSRELTVDSSAEGMQINCPLCATLLVVPALVPPRVPPVIIETKSTLSGLRVFIIRFFSTTCYSGIVTSILLGLAHGFDGAAVGLGGGIAKGLLLWGPITGFVSFYRFRSNPSVYRFQKHVYVSAILGGLIITALGLLGIASQKAGSTNLHRRTQSTQTGRSEPQQIKSSLQVGEITAPGGWERVTNLNDAAHIQISNVTEELYLIILTELKSNFPPTHTLGAFAEDTKKVFVRSLFSGEISSPENITINGMSAIQTEIIGSHSENRYLIQSIEGGVKETKFFSLHVCIEGETHFHQVVAWTVLGKKTENRPILESTIRTFKE